MAIYRNTYKEPIEEEVIVEKEVEVKKPATNQRKTAAKTRKKIEANETIRDLELTADEIISKTRNGLRESGEIVIYLSEDHKNVIGVVKSIASKLKGEGFDVNIKSTRDGYEVKACKRVE